MSPTGKPRWPWEVADHGQRISPLGLAAEFRRPIFAEPEQRVKFPHGVKREFFS